MVLIKWLCRSDSYQMWGQENESIMNRDREVRRKGWNGKKGDHPEERQKREMGGRGREQELRK